MIETPLTKMFNIEKPIFLAGMNVAAGPELAAAVSNNGGLGVIGGLGYTPSYLKQQIQILKGFLKEDNLPFGVDLLLPQVGGNARKTNYDYTNGTLPELIDIIIDEKVSLFVSAVGVPPEFVVDKLHKANIPIMNMIGSPKHIIKAVNAGVDIICAQGGEGGGHTGDIPTSILIPKCCDLLKELNAKSPLTGEPIQLLAAGGIFDGRGLAMALSLGASGVWVGTRFIASEEAGATKRHQNGVISSNYSDTIRTLIFTGRPLRIKKSPIVVEWEEDHKKEIKGFLNDGIIPIQEIYKKYDNIDFQEDINLKQPLLMGQCAGAINDILPASVIMEQMIDEAIETLQKIMGNIRISDQFNSSKL